jgi:hypothetical protein
LSIVGDVIKKNRCIKLLSYKHATGVGVGALFALAAAAAACYYAYLAVPHQISIV